MTKLVRKLKQMDKKRSHRKKVQKRKEERMQREMERQKQKEEENLEMQVDEELDRINEGMEEEGGVAGREVTTKKVGDLVLHIPKKKTKALTRKQRLRKEKMVEKGKAVNDLLDKKYDRKKRRIKVRAQFRNSDLHN